MEVLVEDPKVMTRKDVNAIAQEVMQEKLLKVKDELRGFYDNNNEISESLN
jgi:hypothetical protein